MTPSPPTTVTSISSEIANFGYDPSEIVNFRYGPSGIENFGYEDENMELQTVDTEAATGHPYSISNSRSFQPMGDTAITSSRHPSTHVPISITLNNGRMKYFEKTVTDLENANTVAKYLIKFRSKFQNLSTIHKRKFQLLFLISIGLIYNAYLIVAINYNALHQLPLDWCNGLGFLIVLTAIIYWSLIYYLILKRFLGRRFKTTVFNPLAGGIEKFFKIRYVRLLFSLGAGGLVLTFIILDTWDQPRRLISASGVLVFVAIGFLISKYPAKVKWGQILWAIGVQFTFGLLILRWQHGRGALDCISTKATSFLNFATTGSDFVYGYLSSGKPSDDLNFSPIFAFKSLSVMFFFGFCISLLYHFGTMQWFILKLGWILQITIGTTAAESMNASANMFIGMIEAPLLIKPFLGRMTNSEIHAVMTSGFATVAGAAFAAYVSFGVSASYVISATVMSSFCALGYSKLVYPETRVSHTTLDDVDLIETKSDGTAIDAAAQGAIQGVTLIGCVIANVIAFVSFVTFLNAVISWFGHLVGIENLTFEYILGKIFIPLAWIMGIDSEECETVALLLGLKTIANEFIAYQRLVKTSLSPRSRAIASFALCSFSNVGSVGISLGGLGALVPERRADFGKIIPRAFVSGTIVGFLNGCVAGTLLSEAGYAEWNQKFPNATIPADI